ncbi:uncharacterized protein LOC120414878 [Culex pipiens pallens]|uniref:uncharacterized protein LOC120414878 n=1 Tax=Culex pipiens pallens TaxID=42434 RepID=UPI001954F3A3|nr:uncharacterized protein LOC120414878 [Culex pipiens pallens]XP_052564434.1 uncharacterized protein LOC120414878 [Culex pipiens pallens]
MNRVKRRDKQPSTSDVAENPDSGYAVYVGNLAKSTTKEALWEFFGSGRGPVLDFCFRLEDCTYCPTKVALIRFANLEDQQWALMLNQTLLDGNRLLVTEVNSDAVFTPKNTAMVMNLSDEITEEDLYKRFRTIGAIEAVLKPAHNYGYVGFVHAESLEGAMNLHNQFLRGFKMNIQPIRRNVSMLLERSPEFGSIREKCGALGLKYRPEAESETRLLVTNIPRQTPEEDALAYFERFGKILDWVMEKSAISVMTNSAGVTYLDPKTARKVFLAGPHYFQGGCLDVFHPQLTYGEVSSKLAVLLQGTNTFITNDEIFEAMSECGPVSYIHRVDAVRHCTIVRFRSTDAVIQALKVKQIAGENVLLTNYTERNYNSDVPPYPEMFPKTSTRLEKEETLSYLMEQEQRAEQTRLVTVPDESYRSPSEEYYRNEVRILNYPKGTTMVQFREYFRKHGNVINLRELHKGRRFAEAFVSFDTLLEARRACTMNQRFMNTRRVLIHLASERVLLDPERCVRVTGPLVDVYDEDIYDTYCELGTVQFVLRESDDAAVVGLDQAKWLPAALTVTAVGKCAVQTSRIREREQDFEEDPEREPAREEESYQIDLTEEDDCYGYSNFDDDAEPAGGMTSQGYFAQDSMGSFDSTNANDVPALSEVRNSWQTMGLRKHALEEPIDDDPEMERLRNQLASRRKLDTSEDAELLGSRRPKVQRVVEPAQDSQDYDSSTTFGELLGKRRERGQRAPVPPMMSQGNAAIDVYGDIGGMSSGPPMASQWGPPVQQQGPSGWNAGPPMGPRGPMGPGPGGQMGPGGSMGPGRPMGGPSGGPMGPNGPPSNPDQPQITPLMRSLMQKIETEMSYTQAFSTMPMIEQYRLVNGIINQHLQFQQFTNMPMDTKIGYLCSGSNGFPASYAFGLFTYPQQQQLLALIHADFVKNNPQPLGPGPMGSAGPMNNSGPNITPAMRKLMQKIEAEMSDTQAFCTMPMMEQLKLVDGIIKQHRTFKKFTSLSVDDKIKHLISGANGFGCAYSFTLFTYPQQHMLLSLIHADYIKNFPDALKPEIPRTVHTIVPVEVPPAPVVTPRHQPAFQQKKKKSQEFKMSPATNSLIQKLGSQLKNSAFPTLETKEKVRLVDDLMYNQKLPRFVKLSLFGKIKFLLSVKAEKWFRSKETFKLFTTTQQELILSIIHADYIKNNVVQPYLSKNPAVQEDQTDYSTVQRSRSPSPMTLPDHLNRAPAARSPSPDPFASTSRSTGKSPTWDDGQGRSRSRSANSERFSISPEPLPNQRRQVDAEFDDNTVLVSNLSYFTTDDELTELFGRFGQIVAIKSVNGVNMTRIKRKRAHITFETVEQARRAIGTMHLKRYRNVLLTVQQSNMVVWPRPGYAVKVFVHEGHSELAIYDTFKMCGTITNIWTRFDKKHKDIPFYLVDFLHQDALPAALELFKLNIGWPCQVFPVEEKNLGQQGPSGWSGAGRGK